MLFKSKRCPFCGESHVHEIPRTGWMRLLLECTNMECMNCGGEYIRIFGIIMVPTFRTQFSITPYRHKHS